MKKAIALTLGVVMAFTAFTMAQASGQNDIVFNSEEHWAVLVDGAKVSWHESQAEARGVAADTKRSAPGSFVAYTSESLFVAQENPFGGLPFNNGQIRVADDATEPEAIDVWNYVTNGFHEGSGSYDSSSDTQIVHHAAGGDPLPALDGQIHSGYRRLSTLGEQSLWDAENQPDHTRSQLGGWGQNSSIHLSQEGQREFIVYSVRLDPASGDPSVIEGSVLTKTGVQWLSMVSQFKSIGPSGNDGPVISVYEGHDGLLLRVREGGQSKYEAIEIDDDLRGEWLRIGIDVLWSSDPEVGAYRWWGDLDGDPFVDFEPLTDRQSAGTILPGFNAAAFNIGPYHRIDDDSHVQENGRDYANIQILSHSPSDPWD